MQLIIKIHLYGKLYTILYISHEELVLPESIYYTLLGQKCVFTPKIDFPRRPAGSKLLGLTTDAFFLQPFVKACFNSTSYRGLVLNNLYESSQKPESGIMFLKFNLKPPDQEIIDYAWNEKILRLVWSRVEIENAFSWLSTLGGAYSALGDYFEHCAEEAGRISMRQYKLSRMLGDDGLAARSRLYSALSYSQKGYLKTARHIVRHVADFARQSRDKRLLRMCQGVWAKLKYLRAMKKKSEAILNKITVAGDTGNGKVYVS